MCENLLNEYLKDEKYEEIIVLIDELMLKNPKNASALLTKKAIALMFLKKYEQALTTLKVLLEDSNDEYLILRLIHECYIQLDENKKAEECLKKSS